MPVSTVSRRALLRTTGLVAGSSIAARYAPLDLLAQAPASSTAALDARRAEMGKVPIGKLKAAKRSLADVQALEPTAEFDEDWGKGFMTPEAFVGLVYGLL